MNFIKWQSDIFDDCFLMFFGYYSFFSISLTINGTKMSCRIIPGIPLMIVEDIKASRPIPTSRKVTRPQMILPAIMAIIKAI